MCLFHFPSLPVHPSSVAVCGSCTHSEPAGAGLAAGVAAGAQTSEGFLEILGAPAEICIH